MYDVMATRRRRARRASSRAAAAGLEEADWSPERHRVITGEELIELLPGARQPRPTGGYLFYDCQTDDVRLVLTVLAEAERFGAICANRLRVLELVLEGGRAAGVRVRELESDAEFVLRADNVVNATGVWADRIQPGELHAEAEVPRIRPSRGTHITICARRSAAGAGVIVPAGENRTIFALPWLGRSLIGTTDNNYEGDLDHSPPDPADIDYLLDAVNSFFGTSLRRSADRRVCRGPAADLHRRPRLGRHLTQGGAVRDLERDDHDHRRQAHDLAADGEAGGRRARRA